MPSDLNSPETSIHQFYERVVAPDLNVNSGVYAAIDPGLQMRMTTRGEYEYVGLESSVAVHARELLQVSAFGLAGPTEAEVAEQRFGSIDARRHAVVGVYHGLYAGYVAEGNFRQNGSSGGMATWILAELLRTKRVDAVVQFVPTHDPSALFEYRVSRDIETVMAGSKSRYFPGHLADALQEIAVTPGRYAITAIPSIAYEIRLLQRLRPEFRERIPFVIGLICGHQKTANYATQLAWRAGIEPGDLDYIDFRKKDPTTSASRYLMEMHGAIDGVPVVREARQGVLLGTDWGHGLFKANFSDFTEDAFNETADVVLGDAWLPRYVHDSAGTNVVIARNAEIDSMIRVARDEGRLHLDDCTTTDMLGSQSALVKQSVTELPARFQYITAAGGYVPSVRRAGVAEDTSFARRRIQRSRSRLSRLSHSAWAQAVEGRDLATFDRVIGPELIRYKFWQLVSGWRSLPSRAVAKAARALRGRE